jgi:predicted pyridoxine 5'-phosphate oxidase superfamily flavin-nucleotide-binding protein
MREQRKVRLTEDMKRVLNEQRLGFIASVCPDGTPNLSPKGTTTVWDDEHIIFADICSPRTVANVQQQPVVEINVVDPVARKGYRFKGPATVYKDGPIFEQGLAFYRKRGTTSPIRHIVLVKVERALPLISPAYDQGKTEEEIRETWLRHWETLYHQNNDNLATFDTQSDKAGEPSIPQDKV